MIPKTHASKTLTMIMIVLCLTLFMATSAFAVNYCANMTTKLSHYYSMDQQSGKVVDIAGNSFTMNLTTLQGDPLTNNTGIYGNATNFTGDDRYSSGTTANWDSAVEGTLQMWLRPSSLGTAKFASGFNAGGYNLGDWYFGMHTSYKPFFSLGDGGGEVSILGNSAFVAGQWKLVIIEWSNSTGMKMYVNGTLQSTTQAGMLTRPTQTTQYFFLGADGWAGTADGYWVGTIDEVAIWNRTLTTDEINLCAYNVGVGNFYPYISNSAPTINTVNITALAWNGDKMKCSFNSTDAENDVLNANITWYVNSSLVSKYNETVLGFTRGAIITGNNTFNNTFGYGNNVSCLVNVSDGALITVKYSANTTIDKLDIMLKNSTGNVIVLPKQFERFYLNANVTVNGSNTVSGQKCYINMSNVSSESYAYSPINYTLNTSGNILNLTVIEDNATLVNDSYLFRVCRTNLITNVNVYVNNILDQAIPGTVIPLCSSGYHEVFNTTVKGKTATSVNFSITCPLCSVAPDRRIVIVTDNVKEAVKYDRIFSFHDENLTFNVSDNLYSFSSNGYTPSIYGSQSELNLSCNGSVSTASYDLIANNLTISILDINNVTYSPNIQIEVNTTNTILIDVSNAIPANIIINLSYYNGTFIKQATDTEVMDINSTEIPRNGLYNITVMGTSVQGNITVTKGIFQLNDTINPHIDWVIPLFSNTTSMYVSESTLLHIDFSDVNLFAYEINVFDNTDTLVLNSSITGLNHSTENFLYNFQPNFTGTYWINATVSDSHTANIFNDIPTQIIDGKDILLKKDTYLGKMFMGQTNTTIRYEGTANVKNVKLIKNNDRYNIEYNYDITPEMTGAGKVRHNYRVECDNLYYLPNSKYPGHFVCWAAKLWIDFKSPSIIDYEVKDCGKDCFDVVADMKPDKTVMFESIGSLNIVSESASFSVISRPNATSATYNTTMVNGSCPNSTPGAIIYGIIVFAELIILGYCYSKKLSIIGFFASFMLIPISYVTYGCYNFIGSILYFIALITIIVFGSLKSQELH